MIEHDYFKIHAEQQAILNKIKQRRNSHKAKRKFRRPVIVNCAVVLVRLFFYHFFHSAAARFRCHRFKPELLVKMLSPL